MLVFLKLGGSLITDKTSVELVRDDVLARLAREIREVREAEPSLQIVLGHGSGSYGHVAGAKHGTRQGISNREQWSGFVEVSSAATRLNGIVRESLLAAGLPALSLQPSASARCKRGEIQELATSPIQAALAAGILPVIYGDVAFDDELGGTIISTEEIMSFLAPILKPRWLLLAGEIDGVLDLEGQILPLINSQNIRDIEVALRGSRGTDVTGGMWTKVMGMVSLVERNSGMSVRIFSGLKPGHLVDVLLRDESNLGTIISETGKS